MLRKSNFDKVIDFNNAFGLITNIKPQPDLYKTNPQNVKRDSELINEEVGEYNVSIVNEDINESIDALGDILYVVYGAFSRFGINADEAFDLIHKSNLSKLCTSEYEAILTVESYKNDPRYDSPKYRLSPDGKYYVVYNESTKKILKSIYYKPVSFESLNI